MLHLPGLDSRRGAPRGRRARYLAIDPASPQRPATRSSLPFSTPPAPPGPDRPGPQASSSRVPALDETRTGLAVPFSRPRRPGGSCAPREPGHAPLRDPAARFALALLPTVAAAAVPLGAATGGPQRSHALTGRAAWAFLCLLRGKRADLRRSASAVCGLAAVGRPQARQTRYVAAPHQFAIRCLPRATRPSRDRVDSIAPLWSFSRARRGKLRIRPLHRPATWPVCRGRGRGRAFAGRDVLPGSTKPTPCLNPSSPL